MELALIDPTPIGGGTQDKRTKDALGRLLLNVPEMAQALRASVVQDTFRIVMSNENAHLFKAGADGLYKPFLREGGKFVENVNLAKVAPDFGRLVAELARQVQMAAIMAKLDRIERAVERVSDENQAARRNAVVGRIEAITVQSALVNEEDRRRLTLQLCSECIGDLKVLAGQLKSNIAAMPSEKGGLFEGWFADRREDARKQYAAVQTDIAVLAKGCRAVLDTYEGLGEPHAARVAFGQFLDTINSLDLDQAFRRARLVAGEKDKPAPETLIVQFQEANIGLATALLPAPQPQPGLELQLTFDYRPEELEALR